MRIVGYEQNMFKLEVETQRWDELKNIHDIDGVDSFDSDELEEDARIIFPEKHEGWVRFNDKVVYERYVDKFE